MVNQQIRGVWDRRAPPPHIGFRFMCTHALKPHFKIRGNADAYVSVNFFYTQPVVYNGRSTKGVVGTGEPPPHFFIHVYTLKPHFKIPGYANAY